MIFLFSGSNRGRSDTVAVHTLGADGRSAHRDTIARTAHAEVISLSPRDLVHKLSQALGRAPISIERSRAAAQQAIPHDAPPDDEGTDMPSRVETLIALGRVPLLAALTTRQLADVAERARAGRSRARARSSSPAATRSTR